MSKKSKKAAKEKRLKDKRNLKAQQKARYESYRDQGKNQKSKRFRHISKTVHKSRAHCHPNGKCGNPGCIKCFGVNYRPFLKNGQPNGMPQKMYLQWRREAA